MWHLDCPESIISLDVWPYSRLVGTYTDFSISFVYWQLEAWSLSPLGLFRHAVLLAPWSRHATGTAPSDVSPTQVAWPHKRSVTRREIPGYAMCRCDILRYLLDLLYHGVIRMQQRVFYSVGNLGIGTTCQPPKTVFRCQILPSPQSLILYLKYLLPYQDI